jgi:hypothetical protein
VRDHARLIAEEVGRALEAEHMSLAAIKKNNRRRFSNPRRPAARTERRKKRAALSTNSQIKASGKNLVSAKARLFRIERRSAGAVGLQPSHEFFEQVSRPNPNAERVV